MHVHDLDLKLQRSALGRHGLVPTVACVVLMTVLACAPGGDATPANAASRRPAGRTVVDPATAGALRELVRSSRHASLRWPAFPEFRAEVGRLYERANWQPLWLTGTSPTPAATQLIARLAAADSLGIDPADHDARWLGLESKTLLHSGRAASPEALARFDVGLSVSAVRFVSALHRGRISPAQVGAQLFIPRSFLAVEMVVDSLRVGSRQQSLLQRVQPRLHHYQLLKNVLARYRALDLDTSLTPFPELPRVLKPGMRTQSAAGLRHLLLATGDMDGAAHPAAAADTLYSADLVAGVKNFQVRQGAEPDGVIGPATAARLRRPFSQRVRQIELALERFRWLPVSFSTPPVIVNIPGFRLYAFRGLEDREDDMLAMDVVVGGSFETHTPVLSAEMKYLIFRPYWEVPLSIMQDELRTKALADRGYLPAQGMVLVEGESDQAAELPATRRNMGRIGKDVRVRQRPGPANALGLVKFILPNAHDVYLHDTPAKALFAKSRRDLSHGCIRLSDPVALAVHVLRDQPGWTADRIRTAMEEGKDDTRLDLEHPVPVYIVYSTAVTSERGDTFFYQDIYHLDEDLDRLLKKGYPFPSGVPRASAPLVHVVKP